VAGEDERAGTCGNCSAPLARGQRYCLGCGERTGPRSAQLLALLNRVRDRPSAASSQREEPSEAQLATGGAPRGGGQARGRRATRAGWRAASLAPALARVGELPPPSRRVAALLVLAFLGFGVLLGKVVSAPVEDSLAASARPHLKLLLPAASATAAATPEASAASAEPPQAVAEATPEPAEAPQPASSPAPAQSTGGSAKPGAGSQNGGGGGGKSTSPPANGPATKLPPFKHVFVIMLSDEPYASVFGPASTAPYLSHTLEHRGELLVRYYAVAHEQLANGIALLSGQGPTPATAANCPVYSDLAPATAAGEGQVTGEGCVYPASTETLPGQLAAKHLTARAYVQGIDEPGATAMACAHPGLGQADPSAGQSGTSAGASAAVQAYATFRNPFVYFHALSDSPACALDDVGLAGLGGDLASAKRTPSFSYIVPDRCHDASPGPCPGGGAGGVPGADELLKQLVPKILASRAYKHGGLLVITSDEAPSSGEYADSSSCCSQPRFPSLPAPAGPAAALPPEGGGQVGALLLSPFVKGGAVSQESFNHFSLLRTVEDVFGLEHLGYAAAAHLGALEPSLFLAKPQGK
jgi:phosphatidylinositol-3-phosphatase